MGVVCDYFHAADDDAIDHLMTVTDSGPLFDRGDGRAFVDGVGTKRIDPEVALGKLAAFARNVPWTADLVDSTLVWPQPYPPEYDGPVVVRLRDEARDALADVTDDQLPGLAAEWGRIEELSWGGELPPDAMLPLLTDLVALARRAQAAGNHLYCWICV